MKYVSSDESETAEVTYKYGNKNIVVKDTFVDGTATIELDDNGLAIESNSSYDFGSGIESIRSEYKYTDGYLSKVIEESSDGDYECSYLWVAGNITKATDDSGSELYFYNNVPNKLNIDVYQYYIDCWPSVNVNESWGNIKLKGMYSKDCLVKVEARDYDITIEYEYDKDGYPTKMRFTEASEQLTLAFTYY